ncbi:hypothetical protein [Roseomonas sp. AR75]|uniref:hypothetical protein n=1 Tax=Roseomonas sp. AR75 TaxID=2562311 RepID=UPI0014859D24|nr:hypothetical protein [Roseomonas sp. AR75]
MARIALAALALLLATASAEAGIRPYGILPAPAVAIEAPAGQPAPIDGASAEERR